MKPDIATGDKEGFDSLIKWSPKAWGAFFLLSFVIFVAFNLRAFSFWLPHWQGDQSHYVTLAMKLKEFGMDGYNLRGADLRFINLEDAEKNKFIYPVPTEGGGEGDVLHALMLAGQSYYDEPMHHRAPFFPLILVLAHEIFADVKQPFIVCTSNLAKEVLKIRPRVIRSSQFWAVVVPFSFSLMSIILIFCLARIAWGNRVAFYTGILMATNAMSLMTSYKLWAEETMLFLFTGAMLVYYLSLQKKNYKGIFAGGVLLGFAVMTKQTTGLGIVIVWVYSMLVYRVEGHFIKKLVLRIFNPPTLVFAVGMFLVTAPWVLRVIQIYGNPLYQPYIGWDHSQDISGWFERLYRRPPPLILYTFSLAYVCPLFALFVTTWTKFRQETKEIISGRSQGSWMVFLWVWVLVYYLHLSQIWALMGIWAGAVREHRFFYMAYPAIAIVAATALSTVHGWIKERTKKPPAAEAVILILLFLNAVWSLRIGFKAVLANDALLY